MRRLPVLLSLALLVLPRATLLAQSEAPPPSTSPAAPPPAASPSTPPAAFPAVPTETSAPSEPANPPETSPEQAPAASPATTPADASPATPPEAAPETSASTVPATPAVPPTPSAVAVADADPLPPLLEALRGSDALARAMAARTANARDLRAALPALQEALAGETNPDVAREELRAIVAFADDATLAELAKLLPSYPSRMDAAFAEAIARLGAPRALELYVALVRPLRAVGDRNNFFTLALWNHADLVAAVATRLLALQDARGWRELLHAAEDARIVLAPEVLGAAMESGVAAIREETLWSIVHEHPFRDFPTPEKLLEIAATAHPNTTPRELAARLLLRRAAGDPQREDDSFFAWLDGDQAAEDLLRVPAALLTRRERRRVQGFTREAMNDQGDRELPPPDIVVTAPLPAGAAGVVLERHACRGGWVGTGDVTVDERGHVVQTALDNVVGTAGCIAALDELLTLTLAEPTSITSGLAATGVFFVAPEAEAPCVDEASLTAAGEPGRARRHAAGIQPAKVLSRVAPQFPLAAKRTMFQQDDMEEDVVLEATITAAGCAADLRIVQPSAYESIDDAALLSVAEWSFLAATRNGAPIDSVERIQVTFKLK
jgi:TonB family protein